MSRCVTLLYREAPWYDSDGEGRKVYEAARLRRDYRGGYAEHGFQLAMAAARMQLDGDWRDGRGQNCLPPLVRNLISMDGRFEFESRNDVQEVEYIYSVTEWAGPTPDGEPPLTITVREYDEDYLPTVVFSGSWRDYVRWLSKMGVSPLDGDYPEPDDPERPSWLSCNLSPKQWEAVRGMVGTSGGGGRP